MALATRQKPKVHHRKRQALHHHQGKSYLKTYWPYLPMFAVLGGGLLVNQALDQAASTNGVNTVALGNQPIFGVESATRVQSIFGTQSSTILIVVLSLTTAAAGLFIISHWYRIHRLITQGEEYVIRHPWLEIVLVFIFTAGFVLTRTALGPT